MSNFAVMARISADVSSFVSGMKQAKDSIGSFETETSKLTNLGNTISGVGSGLTKGITVPAMTAATALSGITLKKGFDRLMGIDTARAKLVGLGHDAESVDIIMDNALESVKGTAFGLDKAATSAANAVASGIKPGQELTRYLKMTGDAAAIAGTDIDEMGSIMNKVQAGGRAYTGELNQLADRGLPIWKMLADEMGVAEDAVRDMASNGEISAENLFSAIENNIGGAAQKMGELSTSAAWDNMWAAVGRVGAAFLGAGDDSTSFFDALRPLFNNMIGFLDKLQPAAENLGKKFGNAFNKVISGVAKAYNWFTKLSPTVQKLIGVIAGIAIAAGPFLMVLGKIITLITPAITLFGSLFGIVMKLAPIFKVLGAAIAFLTSPIGLVVVGITALVAAFVYLWNTNEGFRNFFINAWEQIKTSVLTAVTLMLAVLQPFIDFFTSMWQPTFELVKTVAVAVWEFIKMAIENFTIVASGLLQAFSQFLTGDFAGAWETIKQTVMTVWENIKVWISEHIINIWNAITTWFASLKESFTTNFGEILQTVIQWAIDTYERVRQWVSDWIAKIVEWGAGILEQARIGLGNIKTYIFEWATETWEKVKTWVSDWISKIIEWGSNILSEANTALSNIISEIISWATETYAKVRTWVSDWITKITEWGSKIVSRIKTELSNAKTNIQRWVSETWDRIKTWVSNWISKITEWGTNFVNKIITGANEALNEIIQWITRTKSRIRTWGSDFISIVRDYMTKFAERILKGGEDALRELAKGISNMISAAGTYVSSFVSAGRDLIQGLIDGVKQMGTRLVNAAKGVVNDAISGAKKLLGIKSPSRVFRDIGQDTILGMILGIGDEKRDAIKSVTRIASDMSKAFRPDLNAGVNGSMLPNAQMNSTIKHELSSHEKQPMNLNVRIGNHDYKLFVEDITQSQQNQAVLERY